MACADLRPKPEFGDCFRAVGRCSGADDRSWQFNRRRIPAARRPRCGTSGLERVQQVLPTVSGSGQPGHLLRRSVPIQSGHPRAASSPSQYRPFALGIPGEESADQGFSERLSQPDVGCVEFNQMSQILQSPITPRRPIYLTRGVEQAYARRI